MVFWKFEPKSKITKFGVSERIWVRQAKQQSSNFFHELNFRSKSFIIRKLHKNKKRKFDQF